MDFNLTRQQEMLRDTVHEFAETELAPRALELDEREEFPFDIFKRTVEMGLPGIIVSKEYGGTNMGHLARMLAVEEISRVYPPLGMFYAAEHFDIPILQAYGTEEQKNKYLPLICRGEIITSGAITEPAGGSDPLAIQTTAVIKGDEFVINGRKVFTNSAEIADVACILAKTDDKFNTLLVEKGTPGFEITRREKSPGLRSLPISEMAFTNCRVPRANLIGKEGQGLGISMAAISLIGRTTNATVGLGIARGCYEAALNFAKERKLYGKPIGELQAIQFTLADMSVDIESVKWLCYYSAWLLDQGKSPREAGTDIARAKLFSCDVANKTALKAVQIMGGYGLTPEYHVIRRLKDALMLLPADGAQEIMRVTIGRSIMS
jgi:alkylation response protein AidB-like acyl-CoA dehydrogenase